MSSLTGRERIDALRSPDGGLARPALLEILPYGEAFLFVDAVVSLGDAEIEASYRVPEQAPWIDAHFVGFPIMPGALIAEGFAQAGTVLVRYRLDGDGERDILGLQIDRASFARPAFPGDLLTYRARLAALSRRGARLEGTVEVDGRKAAALKLAVAVVERRAFREAWPRRD